jgi:cardiolipin synthase
MDFLYNIKPYVLVVYFIFVSILIFVIILENKKPEKSYAYIFLILLFPVGGILIYFLLGAQYQKKRLYTRKRMYNNEYIKALNKANKQKSEKLQFGDYKKLPTLFYNLEHVDFTSENSVHFLINGEEKFPVLLEELEKAEKTIHLVYYIFNDDKIGTKIIDILCEKAINGVKVRIIYDDVGSSISKKNIVKLKEASVEVYAYMPVFFSRLAHKANYRNHRKIVIVDNKIGFLGGINISDTYINSGEKKEYWRDTHLLLKGQAVIDLQYEFISDWYFVSGQEIAFKDFQYSKNLDIINDVPTCILGSDFDSNFQNIMEAFFGLITNAKKEILITTPYFLPNESILNAIKITAKSGVKIKLLVPKKIDIKTAYYASQTYYKALLESGVEIYYYNKGMMHAKTMVIDDYICTIGSTNMDYRSFNLNAEINAFIVDKKIAKELKSHFEKDLKDSYQLELEELNNRKWYTKVMCSIARLIAPVL